MAITIDKSKLELSESLLNRSYRRISEEEGAQGDLIEEYLNQKFQLNGILTKLCIAYTTFFNRNINFPSMQMRYSNFCVIWTTIMKRE